MAQRFDRLVRCSAGSTGFFSLVHGPGHKCFGYVRRLVTGEEAEMVLDFNENDQYRDGEILSLPAKTSSEQQKRDFSFKRLVNSFPLYFQLNELGSTLAYRQLPW